MAMIDAIDQRLRRWAEHLSGGGQGYPTRNILHPAWMPPAGSGGGAMPCARATDGPETDALLHALHDDGTLSGTQMATIAAVYLLRMTSAQAALALDCAARTVTQRLGAIHGLLAAALDPAPAGRRDGFCNKHTTVHNVPT